MTIPELEEELRKRDARIKEQAARIEELEREIEELKASLKDQVEVMEEEPIAFGMKALLVLFKMEDEGGAQDAVEEKLRRNPLVSSFEVQSVGRV